MQKRTENSPGQMMVRKAKAFLECPIIPVGNKKEPTLFVRPINGSKQKNKPPTGCNYLKAVGFGHHRQLWNVMAQFHKRHNTPPIVNLGMECMGVCKHCALTEENIDPSRLFWRWTLRTTHGKGKWYHTNAHDGC